MGFDHLPVLVLQQVGAIAVQDSGATCRERGRMLAGVQTVARCLDADQPDAFYRDIGIEDAHCIGAAADAGDYRIRLAAGEFRHLGLALLADHGLEVAHHHRVGMRAGHGADDVEGVGDVGHPVAHGFIQRILERLRSRLDRHHPGPQQFHAIDVGGLAADVLRTHVDHAFHPVAGGDGRRGNAMLAGAGFRDHARLAHASRQEGLADAVVDLVRPGVVEVFSLQVDLSAAEQARPALGVIDRIGPADVMLEVVFVLGAEGGIGLRRGVGLAQFGQRRHQGLGDEDASVRTEMAARIRQVIGKVLHLHLALRQ
jgi:hypothetical protein